jgi:hypothetical protein
MMKEFLTRARFFFFRRSSAELEDELQFRSRRDAHPGACRDADRPGRSPSPRIKLEQPTSPASLDGCPMFAKRTWPKKMGRSPFERFGSAGKRLSVRAGALAFSPAMVFIDEKVIGRYSGACGTISREA